MQSVLKYYLNDEAKKLQLKFNPPRELDAGFDLPSLENVSLPAKSFKLLRTGVHLSIPDGWVGLVRDRSSIALKGGATTAGVIDASYRGEVKIAIHNLSDTALEFKSGDRIAQLLVIPHLTGANSTEALTLEELGETERATGGFGSTGK